MFLTTICDFWSRAAFDGEDGGGSAPPAPWYQGKADAEVVGYLQNKGLADKTPADVALAAINFHREAERLIGAPANQIVRLPSDPNDAAGWSKVWQRLGAPAEAKDYDFSGIKRMGDQPLDSAFENDMRSVLHGAGVPKSVASAVLSGLVKHLDGVEQARVTEQTAKLGEERRGLEKSWGQNFAVNKAMAAAAAKNLGLSPEVVDALEKSTGYKATMEALLNLAIKTGEARHIGGDPNNPGNGTLSVEQAIARKAELMRDREWSKSYLAGDTAKVREMTDLNRIITGSSQ